MWFCFVNIVGLRGGKGNYYVFIILNVFRWNFILESVGRVFCVFLVLFGSWVSFSFLFVYVVILIFFWMVLFSILFVVCEGC